MTELGHLLQALKTRAAPSPSAGRLAVRVLAVTALFWATISGAQDQTVCGPLQDPRRFGPFDYRTATSFQKELVEGAHFSRNIETLQKGNTGPLGSEIDYTLWAFPNHPRALMAMMKLGEKEKTERPRGALYPVGCYFERAIRYRPDDPNVHLLRGIYLMRTGKREAALEDLEAARERAADNANVHYNLGLAYFDAKDYEKALKHAKKAYELGFPLEGLRNKLKRAGKWAD